MDETKLNNHNESFAESLANIKEFIRTDATLDDLDELESLIDDRKRFYVDFTCGNPNEKD